MRSITMVKNSLFMGRLYRKGPQIAPPKGGTSRGPPTFRLGLMTNDVHITPEGLDAVTNELRELTTVKRPAIVAKIKTAREFGDLSENFEYHCEKNEDVMMEARINELEAIIKNHVLIETKKSTGVVAMGSTVRFAEDG